MEAKGLSHLVCRTDAGKYLEDDGFAHAPLPNEGVRNEFKVFESSENAKHWKLSVMIPAIRVQERRLGLTAVRIRTVSS